jgi:hypothetical protein
MKTALTLDEDERLRLMRALYSVFWRDGEINTVERGVLTTLNQTLGLHTNDYKGFVHTRPVDIAREVNGIADVRVRVYFMRLVHDVYLRELTELWFMGPETEHAVRFRRIYADLRGLVNLEGAAP